MAAQPTEQDVRGFLEMVGSMDRNEVLQRLKGNNNNVQQAVNEYFDDMETGNTNRYRWDETPFSGDSNHGIAFNVQGPDDPGPYSRFDGAPSRPPSRTSNNKSPLSKVIDLTTEQADPSNAFTNYSDNGDKELQQALAASMADAGLPPQQTGVIGTDQVHFGPATRTEYEHGRWDLVPISSVQEILLDPEPADRQRDVVNQVPAFLKPGLEDHRLGALLTIYHSIPMAKEIFLNRLSQEAYYPHEPEWWTGKPISKPISSVREDQYLVDEDKRFGQELQRVMAFLDRTDRSYGSADVIANLPFLTEQAEFTVESKFFLAWQNYMGSHGSLKHLFSTGVPGADNEQTQEPKTFAILDLQLPNKDSLCETLYDVADETLWYGRDFKLSNSSYLEHIGQIISFRLEGANKWEDQKPVHIPLVWYPDRYLESARKEVLDMRIKKAAVEERIKRITERENFLTYHTDKNGKTLKVEDIFKISLKHDQGALPDNRHVSDVLDDDSEFTQPPKGDLSAKLSKVMSDINNKLKALEEEKEKAKAAWRELSNLYTDPATSSRPLHKYTLRGVSLNKETTYLCRAVEPDLIDMQLTDDDQSQSEGQWWRINYSTSSPTPVSVEKTTPEKVIEDVDAEAGKVILVYASERAMEPNTNPLPLSLEAFVREDNIAFRKELSPTDHSIDSVSSPKSPPKRKYDQCSSSGSTEAEEQYKTDNDKRMVASEAIAASSALQSRLSQNGDVIMGVDPVTDGNVPPGPEMQERGGNSMLTHLVGNASKQSTANDSMEINEIMNDEDIQKESAAVKHVGFAE
ncbi:ubiquitin interaction domain-containing protein [Rutstroemia sp. NJR-2017a WRK4]|nr:ubiquitin interaction domain-containing protein [Rutstroemia sp. NJR-2017a WRK4]